MWSKTHSRDVEGLSLAEIWAVWADVNNWHLWQDDIDYTRLDGDFAAGNSFVLKPKGANSVTIQLLEVKPYNRFVDLTCLPLAKMYGIHDFSQVGDVVTISTNMKIEGWLSWVWRKLVAEKIAAGEAEQTAALIRRVMELRELKVGNA